MKIRGVIHICQSGDWKRSLGMIIEALQSKGLDTITEDITACVVSDTEMDTSVVIPKASYRYMGRADLYERPTLLYLRSLAIEDTEEVYYWYAHTKGLRWFGTPVEPNVVDWIRMMLYWNLQRWEIAVQKLDEGYSSCGCNLYEHVPFYSGNFWWATSSCLRQLPDTIGPEYTDPEFWVLLSQPKPYCLHRSDVNHYHTRYPEEVYRE
jgi:hypothetical protein